MKIALVTGAGRVGALGFETARQLGGLGFHVVLTARKAGQAKKRAEGLTVTPLHLDITDEDSVCRAVAFVRERFGKLDVLINAAALMESPESDFKTDLASARSQFDTNFFGTWRVARNSTRCSKWRAARVSLMCPAVRVRFGIADSGW
ncbi:SDR family NAD(P)-dependent oxidoreductase [Haemophilus parahaemolyticus]